MRLKLQPRIKGVSSIEKQKPDKRTWNVFPNVSQKSRYYSHRKVVGQKKGQTLQHTIQGTL